METLDRTVARIHRAGARAYLALNTLVFETELDFVERVVRRAAGCGVDALIVQDPAVALLARAIAPALEVHASTQMTISSPEGARFARALGVTRVVVPRELSVEEIRRFAAGTDLELEVFVHGALCVAWSGQCLTSATWSGRSANRGECAQSCRMPYDLVLDGRVRELGDVKYLLSPKDLAGVRAVEELAAIGVHGLKIEGRQKGAAYVLTATRAYRHWVDAVARGAADADRERAQADLLAASLAYSRGLSDGFLGGSDHQTLVEGRFPKHRGVALGRVVRVLPGAVIVEPDADVRPWTGALASDARRTAPEGTPSAALSGFRDAGGASAGPAAAPIEVRAGMGVVFDAGDPEDPAEPGGPVFRVDRTALGWRLGFGRPGPDLARVAPGQRVWVTSDPAVAREAERTVAAAEPAGRIAMTLSVRGRAGEPLSVDARARHARACASSESALVASTGGGLDEALLREKLGATGGTPFRLDGLDLAGLAPGLHLPVSELKALRRRVVDALLPALERGPLRAVSPDPVLTSLRAGPRSRADEGASPPLLLPLCRQDAQLEAVIEAGLPEVELDWMELVGLAKAVGRARQAGLRVTLATVRVQKPGEEGYDRRLAALDPDAVLVRHWGALVHFQELSSGRTDPGGSPGPVGGPRRPALHGDFSLNVTNSLAAAELFRRGLQTLTPSHDLDPSQLAALLDASEPARCTVVLHHRMPTFHTEHCVYAHLLSQGRDFRTCGRPCERHQVSLRDGKGREHPVIVDVACRNTVFHAEAQSAAALVPDLLARGVRRFRVELVRETRAEACVVLDAYRDLLVGRIDAREALARTGAVSQVGVSPAPMTVLA